MSLDKNIEKGVEHRKPYKRPKSISFSCRNHGDCEWCLSNRTHKNNKRILSAKDKEKDYLENLEEKEK